MVIYGQLVLFMRILKIMVVASKLNQKNIDLTILLQYFKLNAVKVMYLQINHKF
jgi:hypothetical protein